MPGGTPGLKSLASLSGIVGYQVNAGPAHRGARASIHKMRCIYHAAPVKSSALGRKTGRPVLIIIFLDFFMKYYR